MNVVMIGRVLPTDAGVIFLVSSSVYNSLRIYAVLITSVIYTSSLPHGRMCFRMIRMIECLKVTRLLYSFTAGQLVPIQSNW